MSITSAIVKVKCPDCKNTYEVRQSLITKKGIIRIECSQCKIKFSVKKKRPKIHKTGLEQIIDNLKGDLKKWDLYIHDISNNIGAANTKDIEEIEQLVKDEISAEQEFTTKPKKKDLLKNSVEPPLEEQKTNIAPELDQEEPAPNEPNEDDPAAIKDEDNSIDAVEDKNDNQVDNVDLAEDKPIESEAENTADTNNLLSQDELNVLLSDQETSEDKGEEKEQIVKDNVDKNGEKEQILEDLVKQDSLMFDDKSLQMAVEDENGEDNGENEEEDEGEEDENSLEEAVDTVPEIHAEDEEPSPSLPEEEDVDIAQKGRLAKIAAPLKWIFFPVIFILRPFHWKNLKKWYILYPLIIILTSTISVSVFKYIVLPKLEPKLPVIAKDITEDTTLEKREIKENREQDQDQTTKPSSDIKPSASLRDGVKRDTSMESLILKVIMPVAYQPDNLKILTMKIYISSSSRSAMKEIAASTDKFEKLIEDTINSYLSDKFYDEVTFTKEKIRNELFLSINKYLKQGKIELLNFSQFTLQ